MHRTIKSFVLRAGRMTPRQTHGLETLLEKYTLPMQEEAWDFQEIFGNANDVVVEIGFGMGASLFEMAQQSVDTNFIGIEVHLAGLGSFASDIDEHNLENVRIVNHDAIEVFNKYIADASLHKIQVFFPDPWPKKKHHKRRLIQPDFVKLLTTKLKPNGVLHFATDWQDYALHMLEVLSAEPDLKNLSCDGGYVPRPESRPLTKFEKRGLKLGHGVWDLQFVRV